MRDKDYAGHDDQGAHHADAGTAEGHRHHDQLLPVCGKPDDRAQHKGIRTPGEHLNYNAMQNLLPGMKRYRPWLAEADSQALQRACRRVDGAYQRFFKKLSGYPKFHKRRDPVQSYDTFHPTSLRYEPGLVSLPKVGAVTALDKRSLPDGAKICRATVTRDHGKYYVSVTYKTNEAILPQPIDETKVLGLDYKSDGLYVDSEGQHCDMPH